MKLYVWRHNKTYHSHSMIQEPCVNSEFYLDAMPLPLWRQKALTKRWSFWRRSIRAGAPKTCANWSRRCTSLTKGR